MVDKDRLNPNGVKRSEVDEVFITQLQQVHRNLTKSQVNKYLAMPQAQREAILKKAQAIVDAANAKKKKK